MTEERASELARAKAAAAAVEAEFLIKSYHDKIRAARKAIFYIAVIEAIFAFVAYLASPRLAIMDGVLAAVFFVFYFTSVKHPRESIIAALIIYATPWILMMILFPWLLVGGIFFWIWRIAVIITLTLGVYGAVRIPKPKILSDGLLDDVDHKESLDMVPVVEKSDADNKISQKEPLPRQGQLFKRK